MPMEESPRCSWQAPRSRCCRWWCSFSSRSAISSRESRRRGSSDALPPRDPCELRARHVRVHERLELIRARLHEVAQRLDERALVLRADLDRVANGRDPALGAMHGAIPALFACARLERVGIGDLDL